MSPDKMIYMANQIAGFFATQPGDHQAADVAKHLRAYWDPRMLAHLYSHADTGGAGLSRSVLDAVTILRVPANA